MDAHVFLVIFVVGILILAHSIEILSNCNHDIIYPNINDTVVCNYRDFCDRLYGNISKYTMNDCNIICNSSQQCTGIKIYSASLNTNIYCSKEQACKNAQIFIGSRNSMYSVNIICIGNQSCKSMTIGINGYLYYGGSIDLSGFGTQKFQDSILEVSITTKGKYNFNLQCGIDKTNCQNVTYKCKDNNCYCEGYCPKNLKLSS